MSIAVMTEVWKNAPVAGTELLMLLALADSANDDRECWPSVRHLCKKTRLSDPQVRKLLKKLSDQKLITKAIQKGKGAKGRESNLYTILSMTPITDDKGDPTSTPITDDKSTPITDDTLNHHSDSLKDSSAVANGKKPRPLNKNAPIHDALLECFGLTPTTVTKTGDKTYWTATADFAKIGFPVEKITLFHRWCKGQEWPSFTVMAMAKYAGEWLSKQPNTPDEIGEDGEVRTASYVIGSDDDPFKDEIID